MQPDTDTPDQSAKPQEHAAPIPTSIIAASGNRTLHGYWVGALVTLAALATGLLVYFVTSTSKSANKLPEPHLTSAPRKLVPELKAQPKPELPVFSMPVERTGVPVTPPTDPLHILKQQLDLQHTEKSRQLREARMKSALDPAENRTPGTASSLPELNLTAFKPVVPEKLPAQTIADKNTVFARAASGQGVPSSVAASVSDPEHKILQGKIIEAIILPRIISDLPGTVCALTQRDVYAERGRRVLIPWGSRLCGVYNSELRKGQNRLFTIWNTLRVANPDGSISEVALDSVGSDQLGSAGTGGLVDTHFAEIFGTSALLSIIGAGAANMAIGPDQQNYSAEQYRLSVQQAAAQTAQSVLAPYVNIPPTVTVPAGTRIRIFVNRDLDFSALLATDKPVTPNPANADQFE